MSAEEVARVLGVGPVTVWRWCREGSLPCSKIGRSWRIRRSSLEEFVRGGERSSTLTGRLRAFLEVPDNVLAVVQNRDLMLRLDVAFFRVGEAWGGTLVKFQQEGEGLPSPEELRGELERAGMEVSRLEDEGRLRLLAEGEMSGERAEQVRRLVVAEGEDGRAVWVNFNWDMSTGVEEALGQQRELNKLVGDSRAVIKTTVMEDGLDGWPGSVQRRVQVMHSGTIWLSEAGLALGRVTPPPKL